MRLKGGDPFIFGRGGEELEALEQAGIAVHVVPGITAALGCAAEAGLPLTFRKEATRLSFVTANTADGAQQHRLVGSVPIRRPTVVVYMGLSSAATVRCRIDRCRPRSADAGRGSRPRYASGRRAVVGRLEYLPGLAASVGEGPALLVIGDVVARSEPWKASQVATSVGSRRMTAPSQQKLKVHGPVVVTANRLERRRGGLSRGGRRLDGASRRCRGRDNAQAAKDLLAVANSDDARGRRLCRAGRNQRRADRARKPSRTHSCRRSDLRSSGQRSEFENSPCTSMTISTAPWSTSASANSAIRSRGGCPAN